MLLIRKVTIKDLSWLKFNKLRNRRKGVEEVKIDKTMLFVSFLHFGIYKNIVWFVKIYISTFHNEFNLLFI
jgi:hypothetical protein